VPGECLDRVPDRGGGARRGARVVLREELEGPLEVGEGVVSSARYIAAPASTAASEASASRTSSPVRKSGSDPGF
jgi:hypothetical protein